MCSPPSASCCATLLLTPALYYLPQATLAATIIVAVLSLVDFGILKRTWAYSKADFAAVAATLLATLAAGVEAGLLVGVGVSLALYLLRTSRPHIAVVGLVPGTEHFRNVLRHEVLTSPQLLSLRVDESLYFANARALEDRVNDAVASPAASCATWCCSARPSTTSTPARWRAWRPSNIDLRDAGDLAAPVGGQGPGDGPAAAHRLPAPPERPGLPDPLSRPWPR